MNIKDFLIDNYIWILAIIVITIITIIGFLADKKKSDKTKENLPQQISPPVDNNNQMTNTIIQQSEMNNAIQTNQPSIAQQNANISENVQPNIINMTNIPQPVENTVPQVVSEPIYQPLSEQTPIIAPQPTQNYQNIQNAETMFSQTVRSTPEQSNSISSVNSNLNGMPQGLTELQSTPTTILPNIASEMPTQPMVNYNIPPVMPNYNTNGTIPNVVSNNGPIPQINNMQTTETIVPQPVMPQSITVPNSQPMPTYNMPQQQQHNIPNTMSQTYMNQTNQPTPNAGPVNFVFGPQNNNQNM